MCTPEREPAYTVDALHFSVNHFTGTEENTKSEPLIVEKTFTEADKRTSAKAIGSTAIVMLVITASAILLLDGTTITRHFAYMRKNIRSRFQRTEPS